MCSNVTIKLQYIVYNEIKSVSIWDTSFLNTVLVDANSLYCYISKSVKKDLLLLTDVSEMVSTDNKIYRLQYSDLFSGVIFTRVNNGPFMSLEHAYYWGQCCCDFQTFSRGI